MLPLETWRMMVKMMMFEGWIFKQEDLKSCIPQPTNKHPWMLGFTTQFISFRTLVFQLKGGPFAAVLPRTREKKEGEKGPFWEKKVRVVCIPLCPSYEARDSSSLAPHFSHSWPRMAAPIRGLAYSNNQPLFDLFKHLI